MKQIIFSVLLLTIGSHADVYMHNPRGSNNRNCGTGKNRRNGNRLFDSENNAKGGYACPRAKPFDCYVHIEDDAAREACNNQNAGAGGEAIDRTTGELKSTEATVTERMYYYSGSILPIEWTNQHGSGSNSKVHSNIVIQVACEGTLTDDCGEENGGETCGPRDGTPVNNNDEATERIGTTPEEQKDYRRGRHETLRYYQKCENRERNKGLFAADQDINGNSAEYTRQNPNLNRQGLECKEEAHYWPYWHDSPWIDIAIIASDAERCERDRLESQNVKAKGECICESEECQGRGNLPNNRDACIVKDGKWIEVPPYSEIYPGVEAPECVTGVFSRVNHLGNVEGSGQPYTYNWTVPTWLENNSSCVLRLRYNISTGDADSVSVNGNFSHNAANSPLFDRNEREEESYVQVLGMALQEQAKLQVVMNTNQYGRTFQDRSYLFSVRAPENDDCNQIYNLNVRGKRGNIVQTYPSVEYDFVPNNLHVALDDCVHIQWTGSDYNPARNPNDGEGGPPDPTNLNAGRTDRSNMVQMSHENENNIIMDADKFDMFDTSSNPDLYKKLMFLDQPVDDPQMCWTLAELQELSTNSDTYERYHYNCAKLSGAKTPYFNAGLVKPKQSGVYRYMSTRNNNFTNRNQKGVITVGGSSSASATTAGVVFGAIAGIGVAGFVGTKFMGRRASKATVKAPQAKTPVVTATALPQTQAKVVYAAYEHKASEPGELNFKQGDKITVLREDPSGWWTGRTANGETGLFPSNFVTSTPSKF